MSCIQTGSNSNNCPYIINATNTPTAGTLNSALAYFNGQYQNAGVKYASPISSNMSKKLYNFRYGRLAVHFNERYANPDHFAAHD